MDIQYYHLSFVPFEDANTGLHDTCTEQVAIKQTSKLYKVLTNYLNSEHSGECGTFYVKIPFVHDKQELYLNSLTFEKYENTWSFIRDCLPQSFVEEYSKYISTPVLLCYPNKQTCKLMKCDDPVIIWNNAILFFVQNVCRIDPNSPILQHVNETFNIKTTFGGQRIAGNEQVQNTTIRNRMDIMRHSCCFFQFNYQGDT